jgi:hypothetical protein
MGVNPTSMLDFLLVKPSDFEESRPACRQIMQHAGWFADEKGGPCGPPSFNAEDRSGAEQVRR